MPLPRGTHSSKGTESRECDGLTNLVNRIFSRMEVNPLEPIQKHQPLRARAAHQGQLPHHPRFTEWNNGTNKQMPQIKPMLKEAQNLTVFICFQGPLLTTNTTHLSTNRMVNSGTSFSNVWSRLRLMASTIRLQATRWQPRSALSPCP